MLYKRLFLQRSLTSGALDVVRSNIESTLQFPQLVTQLVTQLDNVVISVVSGLLATCDIHTQFANTQYAQIDRQTHTHKHRCAPCPHAHPC